MRGIRPKTENFEQSLLGPWNPKELPIPGMPKSDRPRARPPARMRVPGRLELIHRTGRPRRIPPPLRDGTVPGSPQATTNVCEDLFARNGFDFTAQILLVAPLCLDSPSFGNVSLFFGLQRFH